MDSAVNPITIMIVDDHPIIRDGLVAILSSESDLKVVAEATTGQEALDCYRKVRPAVIICDLLLPDISGVEVIKTICGASSDVQIVVLTSVGGDEEIYRALEAGARGYLLKDSARHELVLAIRTVSAGRRYIPSEIGGRLAEHLPRSGLSAREIQVLQLVAGGNRNKEIAYKLSISEATVNAHMKHILEKLGASDRAHAVVVALRRGFMRI
jgi:DNA-binding NarL/FixJ family response regulator